MLYTHEIDIWIYVIFVPVVIWFIFFRKNVDTMKDVDSIEVLWKIKKTSEKLMRTDPKLAETDIPYESPIWTVILESKDGNIILTLNSKTRRKHMKPFFLGVGIEQSKGQPLSYWYEMKVPASHEKQASMSSWIGPSKLYLLKNTRLMLPDDVLTLFIRISTYPSPFCIMAENRQSYCMFYHDETEEDKSIEVKGNDKLCLDCKVLKNLSQNLKHLYLEDKDPDVKIIVRNGKIRAHRAILKARSPVLSAMLQQDMWTIEDDNCDYKVFAVFLQFLYSGTADDLDTENVIPVYKIADKYDVPDLMETCARYMVSKLTVHSVSSVISVALKHNDYKLLVHATDFFLRNAEKIFPTPEWQAFLAENPTKANEFVIKSYSYKIS